MEFENALLQSVKTGLINKDISSEISLQPKIITNNFKNKEKVLSTIDFLLHECDEFFFNVAFVTKSGVISLFNAFEKLDSLGIKGKILISKYQNFSDPYALRMLLKFSNIEVRLIDENNFHAKGYLFRLRDNYELIIGSSNLTQDALSRNTEYNLKLSLSNESKLVKETLSIFGSYFLRGINITEDVLNEYEEVFNQNRIFNSSRLSSNINLFNKLKPNSMQRKALENLRLLRDSKINKALLISATATGKTYLSAFDVKEFKAKRVLFVVHRWNIAKKAMESFRRIFKEERTCGLFESSSKEIKDDFIFSTNLTLSNTDNLKRFDPELFDYIIIDETHRAGAATYQKIINYFSPKFLLGMTASPERTDDYDIFELFEHNIAYEIRLQKAMEEELIVPFHYFGITDITVNGSLLDEKADFNKLTGDERVDRIIEKSIKYGCDDNQIRGLVFCSRKEEALELANKFNNRGFKSIALTGSNTEFEREKSIQKLESDNLDEKLDYIFTVDIFNEGIDIPRINQIMMLRPTQSNIVFIQQLGRGLRKSDNKKYLTVIDFIGNYQNNFLIPVALFGDTSYNKDTLRKLVASGNSEIPGASTINFDEISKKRIFDSISSANLQTKRNLLNDYKLLKYRLGRIPMMVDFLENNSRDPIQFVTYSNSYLEFVRSVEKDFNVFLESSNLKLLQILSRDINNGSSFLEVFVLQIISEEKNVSIENLQNRISEKIEIKLDENLIKTLLNVLNLNYFLERKGGKRTPLGDFYNFEIVKLNGNYLSIGKSLEEALQNEVFIKYFYDSINYSLNSFENKINNTDFVGGFLRYEKYTRRDIHKILNWPNEPNHLNIGGYKISDDKENCPIFVTYKKSEDIADTIKYEDKFINSKTLQWFSKQRRSLQSNDVKEIINSQENNMRLPLFLKKDDNEGGEFYFLGNLEVDKKSVEETFIEDKKNNKNEQIVKMKMYLDKPVKDVLYQYLID